MIVWFEYQCVACPGDGVVRPKRPGVDWPEPCLCEAKTRYSQYTLGRMLEEDPKTIVRVHELRARHEACRRILSKLALRGFLSLLSPGFAIEFKLAGG